MTVADARHVRRLGGTVRDALGVEREALRSLPARRPDVDTRLEVRASKDCFVRVGDVDYSVPPRLAGRRLGVRAPLTEIVVHSEREVDFQGVVKLAHELCGNQAHLALNPRDVDGSHLFSLRLGIESQTCGACRQ